jgi:hypothetical protein
MPQCPQCNKPLRELVRRCPSCQADLDLLVDYVSHLAGGLERAENLTKAGELGQAVWAYLEILEVDPDNAAAKKQVAQVATAVRQFDLAAPGRKWLSQSRNGTPDKTRLGLRAWLMAVSVAALVACAFLLGLLVGSGSNETTQEDGNDKPTPPPITRPNTLGG